MAAVTAAVAAAGIGLSVAQAIKQNKLQKAAQRAAKDSAQRLRGISEVNPFSSVQVPTIANQQAIQNVNQQATDTLQALQGAGAEGVIAGATSLNRNLRDAQLSISADQNQMQYQRDTNQAQAQGGVNQRNTERQYDIEASALEGAQQAVNDAQYNKNQAIGNAISGAGNLASGLKDWSQNDYNDTFGEIDITADGFDPSVLDNNQLKVYNQIKANPQIYNKIKAFK